MSTHEPWLDSRTREALARLTENEKACLRLRLQAQTAKEMAIDLGISPHAVEKRLKMARAKLGVSSSLHAARLMARAEAEYQHLGSRPSDLSEEATAGHSCTTGTNPISIRTEGTTPAIMGVIMFSIIAAAAVAAATLGGSQANTAQNSGGDQITLEKIFKTMDRDGSGLIEASEFPKVISAKGSSNSLAKWDTNGDGKISQAEWGAATVVRNDPGAPPVIWVRRD